MDRYDEAVESLSTATGETVRAHWGGPNINTAGCLFLFVSPSGMAVGGAGLGPRCGCLTLIATRPGSFTGVGVSAELLRDIRRVTAFQHDIDDAEEFCDWYDALSIPQRKRWLGMFARYQRRIDSEVNEGKPR